jgi:peptidoglycan hydrolase CwlO-like protein
MTSSELRELCKLIIEKHSDTIQEVAKLEAELEFLKTEIEGIRSQIHSQGKNHKRRSVPILILNNGGKQSSKKLT